MHKTNYLALWVRKNGVRPLVSKLEDIKFIDTSTKGCDVWQLVGIVNYYREMWHKRAHELSPTPKPLTSKVKIKCSE